MKTIVLGYDPGGTGEHGVALLTVERTAGKWRSTGQLRFETCGTVAASISWLMANGCASSKIVAAGIDTLTAWSKGRGGWRPADLMLRQMYREVQHSVVTPNGISGAMVMNGALMLEWLATARKGDGTLVAETHPKVCFFAMCRKRHPWSHVGKTQGRPPIATKREAKRWLCAELNVSIASADGIEAHDDAFDAAVGALVALRGLNGDWTVDLHDETICAANRELVHPFGRTNFWWPEPPKPEVLTAMSKT